MSLEELDAAGLLEWIPDESWTTAPEVIGGHYCRRKGCHRPAVAALLRDYGRGTQWWCYCDDPDHLYGRRLVDGVVLVWRRIG